MGRDHYFISSFTVVLQIRVSVKVVYISDNLVGFLFIIQAVHTIFFILLMVYSKDGIIELYIK